MNYPQNKAPGALVKGEDFNMLLDILKSLEAQPSPSIILTKTSGGTIVEVNPKFRGQGGTGEARWA